MLVNPLLKKERIQKCKQTEDTKHMCRNKLDKACFQNDTAYGVAKRIDSDKVLRDKAFHIAKNPKFDGCQRGLASMDFKFFD